MEKTRMDDMLERYIELCTLKTAGKILSIVPRTVAQMTKDGRLRRVYSKVDVLSIGIH